MDFDFLPVIAGWGDLARGALVTVEVTLVSLVLSCLLGTLIGLARVNPRRRLAYGAANTYVVFIRGTPLLVQLFILFYGLPYFGITLPAFECGVLGLGCYSAAYVSEIVRGAVISIDRGQMEAARSMGMSARMAMRLVVLPQAFVRMIPPLANEFIALTKNSALVSLVTIHDLMHEGQKIISVSYRSLEVYLAIALVYLVLTTGTALLLRQVENRLRAGGMVQ
ncbi:amino acid ABC transporter permease [Herbaspirillum chlorophenolicum]|uniref:Amino acid ABC transporter permease n=1 Tax=Herbaspirillum chlorophenolicum TaxID=211589 RepID=A0ABW8F078_9BURK|nr:amino acid ABC transporter permease [Herbaspirillum chlorophenolicum]